ncbi:MAG TPA: MFS transporter [Steroidobacteraceae bacterium]|nr:MFS transporter [Steroidobacteraceae bacterium]
MAANSIRAIIATRDDARVADDPTLRLLSAPMSRFQIASVVMIFMLCALDGFDVMTITYAAPALLAEWSIDKAQMGYVLSAGLFGMAIGSFTLAPLADVFGRRKMVLVLLAVMVAGTFWTAAAEGIGALAASRVLTGLGIGAMIGTVVPLAAEYSNARYRDRAVSLATMGYGIGAVVGGFVSAGLLASFGWRSVFIFAGTVGAIMICFVWRSLLEPFAVIVAKPGRNGLARANEYLRRCGHPPVTELPLASTVQFPVLSLFNREMLRGTLLLTAIYACYMIPQFYLQTWLPTLVVDAGFSPSRAAMVSSVLMAGGICGGLFIAASSLRVGLKRLEVVLLVGAILMPVALTLLSGSFRVLMIGALVAGFFVMGTMIGLNAIIARTFPAHLRASGAGLVMGVGRLASAVPPALAGRLFTAGFDSVTVALVMSAPAVLSLALLMIFEVRPSTTA